MHRHDLFHDAHKAIRRVLFETALDLAVTDLAEGGGLARAARRLRQAAQLLDEHAAQEDGVVLPALAAAAPELAADLRVDHAKADGLQREVMALLARLEAATERERAALGRRLEDRFGRLIAALLVHLAHEESDVNRVLWARYDDAALAEMRSRMDALLEPERRREWSALVLSALSPSERRSLEASWNEARPA